jgi:Uma2 family endonuclease
MVALVLDMQAADIQLSEEEFYRLCQANRDVRLEQSAEGKLIIMPPTGWETGHRNAKLIQQLSNWADQDGSGLVFDSSTGFRLPNGATRSPDAAWVRNERIAAANSEPNRFLPLCPDFVVELRSASDALTDLQSKMQEYLDNGLQLGWLIDPQNKQVEVYRPNREVEMLHAPTTVLGEAVLLGFVLNLNDIF